MLEVLRQQAADDIESLRLATRMAMAFPAQMSPAERELPIDPAGRARDALKVSRTKALQMHRMAVRAGRKQAVISSELPLFAKSLRDLARVCDGLGEWIAQHDQAFDQPETALPVPLEAA